MPIEKENSEQNKVRLTTKVMLDLEFRLRCRLAGSKQYSSRDFQTILKKVSLCG
jgi:hypothetical protein